MSTVLALAAVAAAAAWSYIIWTAYKRDTAAAIRDRNTALDLHAEAIDALTKCRELHNHDVATISRLNRANKQLRDDLDWEQFVHALTAAELDRVTSRFVLLPTIAGNRLETRERLADVIELPRGGKS